MKHMIPKLNINFLLFIVTLFLQSSPFLHANSGYNTSDKLEKKLVQATDEEKVSILWQLSQEYIKTDTEKSLQYSQEALNLVKQNDYTNLLGEAYFYLGESNRKKGEFRTALKLLNQALSPLKKTNQDALYGHTHSRIGDCYYKMGIPDSCSVYANRALDLLKPKDLSDEYLGYAYLCLSNCDVSSGNNKARLENLERAKTYFERADDLVGQSMAIFNMAVIAFNQGQLESSLEKLNHTINLSKQTGNDQVLLSTYLLMAYAHKRSGNLDNAIASCLTALKINERVKNKKKEVQMLTHLSDLYISDDKFQEASDVAQEIIEKATAIQSQQTGTSGYSRLGMAYKEMGKYEEAQEALKKGLQLAKEINYTYEIAITITELYIVSELMGIPMDTALFEDTESALLEAHDLSKKRNNAYLMYNSSKALRAYYTNKKEFSKALTYGNLAFASKDSLTKSENTALTEKILANHLVQLKSERVKQQEKIIDYKSQQTNLLMIFLFVLASFLAGLAWLYNKTKKMNSQISIQNQQLKEQTKTIADLNERLSIKLDKKNREIVSSELLLSNQDTYLAKMKQELLSMKNEHNQEEVNNIINLIESKKRTVDSWEKINAHFNEVHPKFFDELKNAYPNLTDKDLKYCAYIKMNLSTKDIVSMTQISVKSVEMARYRLKKKMSLGPKDDLRSKILEFGLPQSAT